MLKKMKDKLYYYFAEKNWGVRREYGPYVDAHQEEHAKRPWKHWWLLIRLNFHYRILRKSSYLIKDLEKEGRALLYPESSAYERPSVDEMVAELMAFDVISFDVFDTLIFRPFEDPKDLFELLAVEMDKADFKEIRIATEQLVRRMSTKPNGEIDIYDIYQCMEERYGIDAEKWAAREIELEKEFCYANPYMLEVYQKLSDAGKTMVATSDMYLHGAVIQSILENCGYTNLSGVFVSCDHLCGKRSGQLQNIVKQTFGRHRRYVHIGDNMATDVKASQAFGWQAYHYENINQRGAKYRPQYAKTLTRSLYCGVVNAHLHASNVGMDQYYEHGFVYGGILICGYCEWLNRLAKTHDFDKFLFVARDSDIVSKVYRRYYNEIDNDYILASRYALFQTDFLAHINEFVRDVIERRVDGSLEPKTIQDVLQETDLTFLLSVLQDYGFDPDDPFTPENYDAVRDMIFQEKENIAAHFEVNRKAALEYLTPFVAGHKKVCIVDVGWKGTCTQILSDLIQVIDPSIEVRGAFLGTTLHSSVESKIIKEKIFSYLFSQGHDWDLMHHDGPGMLNVLVELMVSAPTPSLLQYLPGESGVEFLFSDFKEGNYVITRAIQEGIIAFAEIYNQKTRQRKDIFRISPYDAFGPLKSLERKHKYNYDLFQDFEEVLIAGKDVRSTSTIGQIMKKWNLIEAEEK